MAQKVKLIDNVLKELEYLITHQLNPGDKLPSELDLAERFEVGRSTIRESMTALVAKGLITRTNEGTFVSDKVNECLVDPLNILINMEFGNIRDLMQLREILELGTIRLAAENANAETVTNLERIDWQMKEPQLTAEMMQKRDIEFHAEIAKASGNVVLMELLNALRTVIAANIESKDAMFAFAGDSKDMHQGIIEAIKKHDPDLAYERMSKYFQFVKESGAFTQEPKPRNKNNC